MPVQDTGSSDTSVNRPSELKFAVIPTPATVKSAARPGQKTADVAPLPVAAAAGTEPLNPWRLAYVLALALSTVMIAQFLLLSGGSQPTAE